MINKNSSIVITGAGGWFGITLLRKLEQKFSYAFIKNNVICLSSTSKKIYFGSKYGPIKSKSLKFLSSVKKIDHFFHFAFLNSYYLEKMTTQDYMNKNNLISQQVIDYLKNNLCKNFYFASSGVVTDIEKKISKNKTIYAKMKKNFELNLKSIKLTNIFIFRVYACVSDEMINSDFSAITNFIDSSINFNKIVINSKKRIYRSYIDLDNFMDLLIKFKSTNTRYQIYNCKNYNYSLLTIAKIIAKQSNSKIFYNFTDSKDDIYITHSKKIDQLFENNGIKKRNFKKIIVNVFRNVIKKTYKIS